MNATDLQIIDYVFEFGFQKYGKSLENKIKNDMVSLFDEYKAAYIDFVNKVTKSSETIEAIKEYFTIKIWSNAQHELLIESIKNA